jgi:hypothetical protein
MRQSLLEGNSAEKDFINLRKHNFIREANSFENINEHWDVLDKEFGRVDVKAAKRKHRGGPVDYTIWWELKTVKRPPDWKPQKGWGVPNGIERLIAVRSEDSFILVRPESIIHDLRKRCTDWFKGEFGLYSRPNRGDLTTILPLEYVLQNSEFILRVKDDL